MQPAHASQNDTDNILHSTHNKKALGFETKCFGIEVVGANGVEPLTYAL